MHTAEREKNSITDNWDSYLCQVDGKPAAILTDLGLALQAPIAGYPILGYISLALQHPDDMGFPLQEEYDQLALIEDAFKERVSEKTEISSQNPAFGIYAGRCATNNRLDLFFYLQRQDGFSQLVEETMAEFPGWEAEVGSDPDPEWTSYLHFLYPDPHTMLVIQNRRARRSLQELGDDTSRSRFIEHFAMFPNPEAAQAFAEIIGEHGFTVDGDPEGMSDIASQDEKNVQTAAAASARNMLLRFSRPDAPDELNETTFALAELAHDHGGEYQGWAAAVVS